MLIFSFVRLLFWLRLAAISDKVWQQLTIFDNKLQNKIKSLYASCFLSRTRLIGQERTTIGCMQDAQSSRVLGLDAECGNEKKYFYTRQ